MSQLPSVRIDVDEGGSFVLHPSSGDYEYIAGNKENENDSKQPSLRGQYCSYIKLSEEDTSSLLQLINNLNIHTMQDPDNVRIGTLEFMNEKNGVKFLIICF